MNRTIFSSPQVSITLFASCLVIGCIFALLILYSTTAPIPSSSSPNVVTPAYLIQYEYSSVVALGNPLKGFTTYVNSPTATTTGVAMEHNYYRMSSLMSGINTFTWNGLDSDIVSVTKRGRHLILRVFIDYPSDTTNSQQSVPSYLLSAPYNLAFCTYNGGKSPDWENPGLIAAMVNLIQALGNRYDKDNRIGYVEVGLLGHWGEWSSASCPFASVSTQSVVLNAYLQSFKNTRLLIRDPYTSGNLTISSTAFGFHDDSFANDILLQGGMLDMMTSSGTTQQWRKAPFGGEMRPELQECIFSASIGSACMSIGIEPEAPLIDLQVFPVSWLWLSIGLGTSYSQSNGDYSRFETFTAAMGYNFYVKNVQLVLNQNATELMNLTVAWGNGGIAPFYYDLTLSVIVYAWNNRSSLALNQPIATSLVAADSATRAYLNTSWTTLPLNTLMQPSVTIEQVFSVNLNLLDIQFIELMLNSSRLLNTTAMKWSNKEILVNGRVRIIPGDVI